MKPFNVSDKVVCVKLPKVPDAFGLILHRVYTVEGVGPSVKKGPVWSGPLVRLVGLPTLFNHAFFRDLEEVKLENQARAASDASGHYQKWLDEERRKGYRD